jgi:hypothetical protein
MALNRQESGFLSHLSHVGFEKENTIETKRIGLKILEIFNWVMD